MKRGPEDLDGRGKVPGTEKDLVNQYDLAGIACWKLGFETADIWTIMDEVNSSSSAMTELLQEIEG